MENNKNKMVMSFSCDNPSHEKAYRILTKMSRCHSDFVADLVCFFLDSNYSGNLDNITNKDAKLLAWALKQMRSDICCSSSSVDPELLGEFLLLVNRGSIVKDSDIDRVFHSLLKSMGLVSSNMADPNEYPLPSKSDESPTPPPKTVTITPSEFSTDSSTSRYYNNDTAIEEADHDDDLDADDDLDINLDALNAWNRSNI